MNSAHTFTSKTIEKLIPAKKTVYDICGFNLTKLIAEPESADYGACNFFLNDSLIVSRVAKITPTKTGQFVTLWKRNSNGIICPHQTNEAADLYVINCFKEKLFGQFVFSKEILMEKGILCSAQKKGKLGFRVYPAWDLTENKQAQETQKWQLPYFLEINDGLALDMGRVKKIYSL